MVGVGRDLCGSSGPTLLPKQGHPEQAAQDLIQAGLEYLQRRRLHNLPGQPVPGLRHPQREEVLPQSEGASSSPKVPCSASEEGSELAVGLRGEEQGAMAGERSGRREVSIQGSAQPRSAQRASGLPAPVPLQGEPASQFHCPPGSRRTGGNPLGWGQWDKLFFFLLVLKKSSPSERLG